MHHALPAQRRRVYVRCDAWTSDDVSAKYARAGRNDHVEKRIHGKRMHIHHAGIGMWQEAWHTDVV